MNTEISELRDGNFYLSKQDLMSLNDKQWLTDSIVDYYMHLVASKYPDVGALSTFFTIKILAIGPGDWINKWGDRIGWEQKRVILLPVIFNNHLTLVVVNRNNGTVEWLDSDGHSGSDTFLKIVRAYRKKWTTISYKRFHGFAGTNQYP